MFQKKFSPFFFFFSLSQDNVTFSSGEEEEAKLTAVYQAS